MPTLITEERLLSKSHLEDRGYSSLCRIWEGRKRPSGYGLIGSKSRHVHRFAYELLVGPIPDGLYVLHKCDQPACFNPEHLYVGDHEQNMQDKVDRHRGRGGNNDKSQCKRGHLFDEANTYRLPNGHRSCRSCRAEASRQLRARVKEQLCLV